MRRLLCIVLLLSTADVIADDSPSSTASVAVAVIDATVADANKSTLSKRWYVFAGKRSLEIAAKVWALDKKPVSDDGSRKALTDLQAVLSKEDRYSDPRVDLCPGQTVSILVLSRTDELVPSVQISEARRVTRIAEDFDTFFKVVAAIATARSVAAPQTQFRVTEKPASSNGTYRRSTIQITTQTVAAPGKADVAGESFDPDTMKADTTVKLSLINGPKEHWFLSADVPITKASEATFDQSGHQVGTQGTPSNPHAGLNFLLGDVLAGRPSHWWDGLMLKGMIQLSKRPRDSYGGGIGYRFPPTWQIFGQELDSLSLFVAYLEESRQTSAGRKQDHHIRAGISLNLDKALAWFKSK